MKSHANGSLKREIGLGSAIILVIANMVGTGIFTTSGFILAETNSIQMLIWCWILGGVFALLGALSYGELGAMYPHAGGEYAYLKESFGRLSAFISGWISLIVGFSAPIAAAAIAFATYLPVQKGEAFWIWNVGVYSIITLSSTTLIAIAGVLILSYVHYHSLHTGKHVQNFLTSFKILFVTTLIIGGFTLGNGDFSRLSEGLFNSNESFTWGHFAISLIFVSFAYSGWNAASYLGGEIKNPERNLPLSLIIGTAFVTLLYILLNLLYVYALPVEEMSGILELGSGAATALFGTNIGSLVAIAISMGLLSVISAMIMAGPRVYYAMASDGLFFRRFRSVSPRTNTPGYAILLQASIAIVMILTSTFETLLIYIGFTLSLSAMITVIGMMRLRRLRPHIPRPYKTFLYPYVPLAFILGNLGIIIFTIVSRPIVSMYGIVTILIAIVIYYSIEKSSLKPSTNL